MHESRRIILAASCYPWSRVYEEDNAMRHFTIGMLILIVVILNPVTFLIQFGISSPVPYEYPVLFTKKFYIALGLFDVILISGVVYLIKNKLRDRDVILMILPIIVILVVFNMIFNSMERSKLVMNITKSEAFKGVDDMELLRTNVVKFFSDDLPYDYVSMYENFLMPTYKFNKHSTEKVFNNTFPVRTTIKSTIATNIKPVTIWFFGGSTMHSIYTLDHHTIPSFVTKYFDGINVKVNAINFGVSSLNTSYELMNFIKLLKNADVKPDIVVFYDGYNDSVSYLGFGETHIEIKGRVAIPVKYGHFDNALFNISQFFSRHSLLYKKIIGDGIYYGFYNNFHYEFTEKRIEEAVDNYMKNIRMISIIARDNGVTPVFILQPMPFTKDKLTEEEKTRWLGVEAEFFKNGKIIYDRIRESNRNNPHFHDFSSIFNGIETTIYFDQGHVSATGNDIIGKEIFNRLKPLARQ